jgi:hypothetical protein
MGEIMRSTGSTKSSKLRSVSLERMKHIIAHSVTVAHPKDG